MPFSSITSMALLLITAGGAGRVVMQTYREEHSLSPTLLRWLLQRRRYTSVRRGDVMTRAMDNMNSALMSIHGITPQQAANRREELMEEELMFQEASRIKVVEWRKTTEVSGL